MTLSASPSIDKAALPILRPSMVRIHWTVMLVAFIAAWVFFFRLGATPLNDWDEAWHAQVSREILSTGDWMTLHCRGELYFNKPPLTFWLRAIAFRIGGINEAAARFFPALFGWGTVVAVTWFVGHILSRVVGLLAGLILSCSWLFAIYHNGRSGEADSALVFFSFLTFISIWQARRNPNWFYGAAVFTALGWMAKGATTYLPWIACLLAVVIEKPARSGRWCGKAAGGLILAIVLTAPWQALMLARYGHAFIRAFYVSEGAGPALNVVEDHPGSPMFYFMVLHQHFQPWWALAVGGIVAKLFTRKNSYSAAIGWLSAWAATTLAACTLFATKMVWYVAPALPALATLAAWAGLELCRRKWGWIVLAGIAGFGVWQTSVQHWDRPDQAVAIVLFLSAAAVLVISKSSHHGWQVNVAAILLALPFAQHFRYMYGTVVRDRPFTGDTDLRTTDEPWRELARRLQPLPHNQIIIVDMELEPAAYFYLSGLTSPIHLSEATSTQLANAQGQTTAPNTLLITRTDLVPSITAKGARPLLKMDSLVVLQP